MLKWLLFSTINGLFSHIAKEGCFIHYVTIDVLRRSDKFFKILTILLWALHYSRLSTICSGISHHVVI